MFIFCLVNHEHSPVYEHPHIGVYIPLVKLIPFCFNCHFLFYSPIPKTLKAFTIYPEKPGIESSIGSVIASTASANKMFLKDLMITELRSIIVFPLVNY